MSLLTLLLFLGALQAGPSAAITGRVTDNTGATIADVEVQAVNVETGVKGFARTNEDGLYQFPNLSPGIYRLVLLKLGFRTVIKPAIELRVQDIFAFNFEMRIGSAAESVTEEQGAPILQAETATLTQVVDRNVLSELPTRTYNPHDFVGLSAGAVAVLDRTGGGVGFALNGQRSESANFLLDGGDSNTNPATTRPGQLLPYDAVREYRILSNSFTADYGRNAGFVTNLVTKSGTNEVHGSLYESVRNSALAANSFEDNAYGRARQVFNRNHIGGSLGAPLVVDKAFVFGAFESILVRSWEVRSFRVPTPELLAISSPATRAIFSKYPLPGNLSYTGFGLPVTPFGANQPVFVRTVATVSRRSPVDKGAGPPQNTHLGIFRADYSLGRTLLTGRYALEHGNEFAPATQAYSPDLDQPVLTRHHNATLNMTRSWSGSILTESRLAFSRLSITRPETGPNPDLHRSVEALAGLISLPRGIPRSGGPRNLYQVHQTASVLRRNHHLKFGGQIAHQRDSIVDRWRYSNYALGLGFDQFVNGRYPAVSIWFDFLTEPLKPDRFEGRVESPYRSWHLHYNDAAWFIQDTWKLARRITLTPGLRWEYFGVQYSGGHERNRDVNFYLGEGATYSERFANGKFLRVIDAPGEYRNHFIRPDRNNFGPRLGVAIDVAGDGKTIARAGGGLFFDSAFGRVPTTVLGMALFQNVSLTAGALVTGLDTSPGTSTLPFVEHGDPDRRTAYSSAWNATIERDLASTAVLSASYVGSAGSKLELAVLENSIGSGRYAGRPSERILSNYAYFLTVKSLAHSSYHSLQLKAEARQIRPLGLQFGANYTWSHSIDNASDRGVRTAETNPFGLGILPESANLRHDRGHSNFDQRHRFVTHFIWAIPAARNRSRLERYLAAGWQVSGILSFQTGLPFPLRDGGIDDDEFGLVRPTVTGPLPQVFGEKEMIPDPQRPNRFMYLQTNDSRDLDNFNCIPNAAPFGCVTSIEDSPDNVLARNYYRRPGTHFQDIAITKKIALREHVDMQIRAEFYNVFNHANLELEPANAYYLFRQTVFTPPNIFSPVFAAVTARYGGPPRQIVLAGKIIF
jgi:Carboxypeptidase regulatory-like domain